MAYKEKVFTLMDGDQERTFKIKKFNALTGSFILYNILNKVLPAFLSSEFGNAGNGELPTEDKLGNIAKSLNKLEMSRDEFVKFQLDCLSVCYEVLPGREVPVIDPGTGNFGAIGLEDNTAIVMNLTVRALMFNVKDFFQDGGLTSLMMGLADRPMK